MELVHGLCYYIYVNFIWRKKEADGGTFALIVHGIQTFLVVLLGIYALIALPIINKKIRMKTIHTLSPQNVWKHFYSLTRIPRPSGHVEEVREFLVDFGKNIGLESFVTLLGMLLFVNLQPQEWKIEKALFFKVTWIWYSKNNDKVHDFTKDPIETVVDGEWLKVNGTTLGADNGLGVAAAMAVL